MSKYNRCKKIGTILSPIIWCFLLHETDSRFHVYIFISIISISSAIIHCLNNNEEKRNKILLSIPFFFSLLVCLANYNLFTHHHLRFIDYVLALTLFITGEIVFYNIFLLWLHLLNKTPTDNNKLSVSFSILFLMLVFLFISYLFCFFSYGYPAIMSTDSMSQMIQLMYNKYSNHHPFYHTLLIKCIVHVGMKITNNMNIAVAFYSIFQMIVMIFSFGYLLFTLAQIKANRILFCTYLWYLLMPFHIVYSFTMWKDVLFGGMVSILIVSLYRILKHLGKYQLFNYFMFFISGMGMCLFRSNGWFAFLICFFIFLFLLRGKNKILLFEMCIILLASFILIHPVLDYFNIPQPDNVEHLSIPAQQIARVITSGHNIGKENLELLEQIIDIEKIPSNYAPGLSDPIKTLLRNRENTEFINENPKDFFLLWLELGINHPIEYIQAWIDQTKGYWNGGYDYWIYNDNLNENTFGIKRTYPIYNLKAVLESFWGNMELYFQIFFSIGFHVWIILLAFFTNIIKKQDEIVLSIPIIAIILTLLVATPVYSEFRYAYSVFTSIPIIIAATAFANKQTTKK